MNTKITNNRILLFIAFSLALHGLIFFYYPVQAYKNDTPVGHDNIDTINLSFVNPVKSVPAIKASPARTPPSTTIPTSAVTTNALNLPSEQSKETIKARIDQGDEPNNSSNKITNNEPLLNLLHAALNRNKKYPISALRMHQQGMTRLGFVLYSTGRIEHIRVELSSGNESLDTSAVEAVENIAPFYPAKEYIDVVEHFHINITFQL